MGNAPPDRDPMQPRPPGLTRIARHLASDHRTVRRAFPQEALARIEAATSAGEKTHAGQVRFVVEGGMPLALVMSRQTPHERALDLFGSLRIWDTEGNSGVLVYVLLADRRVEIVADRGIHRNVGDAEWQSICRTMESAFREGRFADGAVAGVKSVNALLARHFPRSGVANNELPDQPIVL
jgi:TPM domain